MKTKHALSLLLFSALMLGCPYDPEPRITPYEETRILFSWYSPWLSGRDIEGGVWGEAIQINASPEFIPATKSRLILKGPGALYVLGPPDPEQAPYGYTIVPYEDVKDDFRCNGFRAYYRPPPDDEIPPEGTVVTFACECWNPLTEKWDRSPDFPRDLARRGRPMIVFVTPRSGHPEWHYYYSGLGYPERVLSDVTVTSGEVYERFGLHINPVPAEDTQMKHSLSGPDGYIGNLGRLEMVSEPQFPSGNWIFTYTAPVVFEPVDIVAKFSVYDPWIKARQEKSLTFHVVPKE